MNIMNGITNLLQWINDNWTAIIVIIGLVVALAQKINKYLNKSTSEKVEIAKSQIKEVMLKFISDAECDYTEWNKAGSIKRAQVINEIFEKYPILNKVSDREALIKWVDENIDDSLNTLREIIDNQIKIKK